MAYRMSQASRIWLHALSGRSLRARTGHSVLKRQKLHDRLQGLHLCGDWGRREADNRIATLLRTGLQLPNVLRSGVIAAEISSHAATPEEVHQ